MQNVLFFLICPIGFEDLLLKELNLKTAAYPKHYKITKTEIGGIEIETTLNFGLYLNKLLKIPSRILLRIKSQKCRDLPKLYNILRKINWKTYLKQENVQFKITAKKSRLIHTTKIEESALKAVNDFFKANKIKTSLLLKNASPQLIFLRLDNDDLTISLDTSGELLHKRSGETFRGHAGIRENIAAALLLFLLEFEDQAAYKLIDPMCGSGTFLREAQSFFKLNTKKFAYENWNLNLLEQEIFQYDEKDKWNFSTLKGIEIDQAIAEKLVKKNPKIEFENSDFFKTSDNKNSIIILNPPYGKRIKILGQKTHYYNKILKHLNESFSAHKIGIIIPKDCSIHFNTNKRLSFNQNGIAVEFLIYENK